MGEYFYIMFAIKVYYNLNLQTKCIWLIEYEESKYNCFWYKEQILEDKKVFSRRSMDKQKIGISPVDFSYTFQKIGQQYLVTVHLYCLPG